MKNTQRAFTLLEVMIALSLSCVVVFGMLQTYRNLMTYLDKVRDILTANRQVCLLFNQMERDFNTAFIPPTYKDFNKKDSGADKEKQEDAKQDKKILSKEEQEKEKQNELEKRKNYFLAFYEDQEGRRFEGRMAYPCKSFAMINTNPLQVYGQRRVRLARVMYELKLDKEKSKRGVQSYQLWRKETADIDNVKMKIDEFAAPTEKEKANPIRTHLVADNIKTFYVEYVYKVKNEKGDDEARRLFSWGDRKETMGVVPARADLYIEFWNAMFSQSHAFRASFVVFTYPTSLQQEHEEKKEKEDDSKKDDIMGAQNTPQVPPTPPLDVPPSLPVPPAPM